jgi:uncharacterized protein (TIGR02145 family)
LTGQSTNFLYSKEDYMRGLGRAVMMGTVMLAATLFNCASNAKTSTATANNAETETAAPRTPIKYVAVVETEMDAQSGASAQLNPAEVRQVTAVLRKEAVKNLPLGRYNIMTSETVQAQGGAVLEECADENCVITLGSKIGADYIVRGTISKFGTMLTVSVDIYETNDGNLVASSELVRSENIVDLLDKTAGACADMYRTFENQQRTALGYTQKVVTPQTQISQQAQPLPIYQQSDVDESGVLTDGRDGTKYKTTVIGGKRWMAENLNYQTSSGSWYYKNDNSKYGKYGRLYDWNTARMACPTGWRLPTRNEWNNLGTAVGGKMKTTNNKKYGTLYYYKDAAKKLKARNGWNGIDSYGFSALSSGVRGLNGKFVGNGILLKFAVWWTETTVEQDSSSVYLNMIFDGNLLSEGISFNKNIYKEIAYSVRCVTD